MSNYYPPNNQYYDDDDGESISSGSHNGGMMDGLGGGGGQGHPYQDTSDADLHNPGGMMATGAADMNGDGFNTSDGINLNSSFISRQDNVVDFDDPRIAFVGTSILTMQIHHCWQVMFHRKMHLSFLSTHQLTFHPLHCPSLPTENLGVDFE